MSTPCRPRGLSQAPARPTSTREPTPPTAAAPKGEGPTRGGCTTSWRQGALSAGLPFLPATSRRLTARKWQGLGDEDVSKDDDAAWVERSRLLVCFHRLGDLWAQVARGCRPSHRAVGALVPRALQAQEKRRVEDKRKAEAQRRALEALDAAEEEDSDDDGGGRAVAAGGGPRYTAKDLAGLKVRQALSCACLCGDSSLEALNTRRPHPSAQVRHGAEDLVEGETVILTLKDSRIIGENGVRPALPHATAPSPLRPVHEIALPLSRAAGELEDDDELENVRIAEVRPQS